MKRILAVIAAVTVLSLQAAAQNNAPDAGALISDATKAMGTTSLRSLQYTGTGSINPTGQAYTTGGAWPRYTVTKYTMSIDYSVPAMRQELVRIDDAKVPRGGGAGATTRRRSRAASARFPATSFRTTRSMDARRRGRLRSG